MTCEVIDVARVLMALGFGTYLLIRLEVLNSKIDKLIKGERTEMADFSVLTSDVEKLTSVDESAVTLINGLAQQIKDAGTDPVKLKALTDKMETETDALAAAVTANTPAAPAV